MKTLTFQGDHATGKLRDELVDAGVPAEWDEKGQRRVLVVQQEEDLAVAYEEPEVDSDGAIIMAKGVPVTKIVWRRPSGEPVKVPAKLIPERVESGAHVQIGPSTLVVHAPDVAAATVAKVVAAHDPIPPAPAPTLEERIAELERQLAKKGAK